jgi:OOP family OmpA-OmpF porin
MRLRTALAATACGVATLPCARLAHATNCSGPLDPCINDDILWPHAGPAQFVSIGSTDTLGEGRLGFGLVSTYLSRPLVLTVKAPGDESQLYAVDNLVNGTFLWAYGVTERLELDLAVPLTYYQDGTGLSPVTGGLGLNNSATRDLRFGFTYALVRHQGAAAGSPAQPAHRAQAPSSANGFGLAGRFEVSAPSGDRSQFAAEGYGVLVPSLAADFRAGGFFAGLEVGARVRPTANLLGASIGTQIVTALGAGYDILPRSLLTAVLEAWALPTLAEQNDVADTSYATTPNGKHITPAEWQLSARTAPLHGGDVSIQLGGGGELPLSGDVPTQPRFRFTLGIRWAPTGSISAIPVPADPSSAPATPATAPTTP